MRARVIGTRWPRCRLKQGVAAGAGTMNKLATTLIHVAMLALVCAIAAYWGVRIFTPQPTAAPPPLAAPPPREPDPVQAARMFGLIEHAAARVVSNIQVAGLFAAGKDSSAVLVVDGKPPRAYVIGQDVVPGTRLIEVNPDMAVLEAAGGRQELRAPPRPSPVMSAGAPARAYVLEGNNLSAPASANAPGAAAPVYTPPPTIAPPPPAMPATPPGVPLRQAPGGAPGVPADTYTPGQPIPPPPAPTQ